MATYERIKIYKRKYDIIGGRREDKTPILHYKTSCEIGSLYGTELYGALDLKLENTIIFEVRYCKKIKEMRQHLKEFYVEYEGEEYNIFASDFRANEKQYVQLKANRVD